MKKIFALLLVVLMSLTLSACGNDEKPATDAVVEDFTSHYEVTSTSYSGEEKVDSFIFEGKTTDGIITELNIDIISNVGTDKEISRKDIMGYLMNVSDARVAKEGEAVTVQLNAYGSNELAPQFMVYGTLENATAESTFGDLTFVGPDGKPVEMDYAVAAFASLAKEHEIALSAETTVAELLKAYDTELVNEEGAFVEGSSRVSFAGLNGGRSYGEQLDAIAEYILANNMTLEDVLAMFENENQMSTPIEDRDLISGATISFIPDFQNMVKAAINGGELPVEEETETEGETPAIDVASLEDGEYEGVGTGMGGDVKVKVTVADGKITNVEVLEHAETEGVCEPAIEQIPVAIVEANSTDVDVVTNATVTSNAIIEAVNNALSK